MLTSSISSPVFAVEYTVENINSMQNDQNNIDRKFEMIFNNCKNRKIQTINFDVKFSKDDILILKDFITKINTLVDVQAIYIDNNLQVSSVIDIVKDNPMNVRSEVFDIMGEARFHAKQLKQVYDNAIFNLKYFETGTYFRLRVKSGGSWDYKRYLGKSVFNETTLKSLAGMYQLISGTSSLGYWDSFFDDPTDQYYVQLGINKYKLEH